MEREKEIEEIVFTRSPIERQIDMYGCEIGVSRQWYEETCCILEDINKGIYRKIPKNAVVMTREELEKERKEERKKILLKVYTECLNERYLYPTKNYFDAQFESLCKRNGIKVDEE